MRTDKLFQSPPSAYRMPEHDRFRGRSHRFVLRRSASFLAGVVVIVGSSFIGCSSSEETGAARTAGMPEQTGPIVREPLPDTLQALARQPAAGRSETRVGDPAVRRGRDTVRASTHRVARSQEVRSPLVKPPNAMYTVQVGAYRRASNALAMQKLLRAEHGDLPVFNIYAQPDGLYRVTIGKFETLREATNYRNTMMKQHPKRFSECWVTYIERSR